MQLIKAYSVFNNSGRIVSPRIVDCFLDNRKREIRVPYEEQTQIIKTTTAQKMKNILIKTVNEGTGIKAKTDGLEIGGKTGTAHIVEGKMYVNKYNTSFIGFANDTKNRYSIGVVVVQPTSSQFAAQTSVPVFKGIVDILTEDGYLVPKITPQEQNISTSIPSNHNKLQDI